MSLNARALLSSALAAMVSRDFGNFGIALQRQRLPDSLTTLFSPELREVLARELGHDDPANWILRPPTWDVGSYTPRTTFAPGETLLHLLWQDLSGRLIRKLDAAFQQIPLASQGAVLCFFGDAALSIIVGYRRSTGGALSLRPIAAVEKPQGVFELSHLLENASPEQRNSIKAAALSVDKLLFQRGVLVHVDRQRDDVFGPTIDTVLLAEMLAQSLDRHSGKEAIGALEVGPGNGLLATVLATFEGMGRLYAVDLNPSAVVCTLKNLRINGARLDAVRPELHVRAERFTPQEFARAVDLIVCNPPYIPDPPPSGAIHSGGYHLAVSGLGLYSELLGRLDSLLTREGRLLLMTSSVSIGEVMSLVPPGFHATPTLEGRGRRVPLDVDVVWERRDWQQHLLREGRIEADAEGNLWHYIHPVWIARG